MSSMMSTVLPTPAPPKRPILPPLMYGAIRSTTLRPVSKISTFGERSRKAGGSRWIGQRSVSAGMSSFSSIAWPMTFQRRPSVASPTGTVIGAPVSTTSVPRARPSVESIATARTRSSPRCCWTSATIVPWGSSISTALRMPGRRSGKTASITTPLISTILPTLRPFSVAMFLLRSLVACAGKSRRNRSARVRISLAELPRLSSRKRRPVAPPGSRSLRPRSAGRAAVRGGRSRSAPASRRGARFAPTPLSPQGQASRSDCDRQASGPPFLRS